MSGKVVENPEANRYFRKQVESIKRKKLVEKKVVNLKEYRELREPLDPKSVLVVDDDEVMRNAMKRILEGEGYKVILAEDGLEFSKILENTMLDIIILDINLPWVDGYELCSMIKSQPNLRETPLIMVSAYKSKEDIEKGFAAGCDDYVTKPFDVAKITDSIAKALLKSG